MKNLSVTDYLLASIVILLLIVINKPAYNQSNKEIAVESRNLNIEPKYYNLVIDGKKILKDIEVYDFDTESTNVYVKSENFNDLNNKGNKSCYLEKVNKVKP